MVNARIDYLSAETLHILQTPKWREILIAVFALI